MVLIVVCDDFKLLLRTHHSTFVGGRSIQLYWHFQFVFSFFTYSARTHLMLWLPRGLSLISYVCCR